MTGIPTHLVQAHTSAALISCHAPKSYRGPQTQRLLYFWNLCRSRLLAATDLLQSHHLTGMTSASPHQQHRLLTSVSAPGLLPSIWFSTLHPDPSFQNPNLTSPRLSQHLTLTEGQLHPRNYFKYFTVLIHFKQYHKPGIINIPLCK